MAAVYKAAWFWMAFAVVVADQLSKTAVLRLTPENFSRPVIPGLFNLVHTRNRGVAFGLFSDHNSAWFTAGLVAFAVLAMGVLVWLLTTGRAGHRASRIGLALILGGAAGNLADRLAHGSVVDFLEFFVGSFHWPAFNLADSAITIGAGLVILELILTRHHVQSEHV